MLTADTKMRNLVSGVRTGTADDEAVLSAYASAAWTYIAEPGDVVAGTLRQELGSVEALRVVLESDTEALKAATSKAFGQKEAQDALRRWQQKADPVLFSDIFQQAAEDGQRLIIPGDWHWPAALDDLGISAPAALWFRGNIKAVADMSRSVAIIGARACTRYGETVAGTLAGAAVRHDVAVITGGAYGIDSAATRSALSDGGGTVTVMAGGLDRQYPAGNADMFRQVEMRGAVISELPSGTTPTRWRFLQRNRLIAALASATVVVEAGARSGSLNAARHAAELGRPLGAVPGPITSAASTGCHRAIRELGAELIESGEDMFQLIGDGRLATA